MLQQDDINTDEQPQDNGTYLGLLFALEKSIIEGAHITQRLYIPRNLW
jgi:hypothetical protein